MSLPDNLRALRDRALHDLDSAQDYYADTKIAWQIVQVVSATGYEFSVRHVATGTIRSQSELAGRASGYIAQQVATATFQQFLSIFESFVADLLRLWLTAYPQNLSGKKIDFKTVLDLPDRESVVQHVVDKDVGEVLYDRPARWFEYLESIVKLGRPSADEIERIAEAKASRDALVHNRGIAGKLYRSKAGRLARYNDGERVEISEAYHHATWRLLRKAVDDVSIAAIVKAT